MVRKKFVSKALLSMILIGIFVGCIHMNAQAAQTKKTVLILNSYHQGYAWSDEETNGVISALEGYKEPVRYYVEYLDTKNHAADQYLDLLYKILRFKYSNIKIDVIIAMDDNAVKFASKHRDEIFANVPIVFCGVNKVSAASLLEDTGNITGIYEDNDAHGTLDAVLEINPAIENVYLISDQSESGLSTWELVRQAAEQSFSMLTLHSWLDLSEADMLAKARELDEDSIILITSYVVDENGLFVSPTEFCNEISMASSVPVYHLYKYAIGYGTVGGSLLDGTTHGNAAAQLAIRILDGENPENIPISNMSSTDLVFDYEQLERFNLIANVPEGSEIINKPFSFFEEYRLLVYTTFGIFTLLALTILVLSYNIGKRKKAERTIKAKHAELSALYSQLEAAEEQLRCNYNEIREMAFHDPLTKLSNRAWLEDTIRSDIWASITALIVIDIDKFKNINDGFGHNVGDLVLIDVSEKLKNIAEQEKCYITRLESDEFAILYTREIVINELEEFMVRLHKLVLEPVYIGGFLMKVGFSIGAALRSDTAQKIDSLIRQAYLAVYAAKIRDKDRYCIFEDTLENKLHERLEIEGELQRAITHGELCLYYQPQFDMKTHEITGVEALLRWNNPEKGLIYPNEFIQIAEESRLIIQIGDIVFNEACRFSARLLSELDKSLRISINVSSHQLRQHDFLDNIRQLISKCNYRHTFLAVEITETALIQDFEDSIYKLNELKAMGIHIHLDDFGTGYSSLNYIKALPIDVLKIDRTFIHDLGIQQDNDIIEFIIGLAHKLGIQIIAEGVETEEQWDILSLFGCDTVQGYLKGRPMPEDEIIKLLRSRRKS